MLRLFLSHRPGRVGWDGKTREAATPTKNKLLCVAEIEHPYDDNGNATQLLFNNAAMFSYHDNAQDRQVRVEDVNGSTSAEYAYDPFGRRLWKEVGATRTYFFYADEGLVAEYDATGTETTSYGYKPDSTWTTDPLWLKQGGEYYFYQNDHLGTPQKLVKQNGAVVWSAGYTAFGQATVEVEIVTNNLRFPGQYYDAETKLHYNRFRYYDPMIGRFLRADPLNLASGNINFYDYVYNNPLLLIDPFGLQCKKRLILHTVHEFDCYIENGREVCSSHTETFKNAADRLKDEYNYLKEKDVTIIQDFVRTGQDIVDMINAQEDDSIISLYIFSHSSAFGIQISRKMSPVKSPWLFRTLRPFIRPEKTAEETAEMEETVYGLYGTFSGFLYMLIYYNQMAGEGVAHIESIDFEKFSNDTAVEFHGCHTGEFPAIESDRLPKMLSPLPIPYNFAVDFFQRLYLGAGKTEATVTGHVGLSGPPEDCPGGPSYKCFPKRKYKPGFIMEELNMDDDAPFWTIQ